MKLAKRVIFFKSPSLATKTNKTLFFEPRSECFCEITLKSESFAIVAFSNLDLDFLVGPDFVLLLDPDESDEELEWRR